MTPDNPSTASTGQGVSAAQFAQQLYPLCSNGLPPPKEPIVEAIEAYTAQVRADTIEEAALSIENVDPALADHIRQLVNP